MTLRELKVGESAIITGVGGDGVLRQHLLDMGLLPGVTVKILRYAPMGDPLELVVRGYTLSLRCAEASLIEVCAGECMERQSKGEVAVIDPIVHAAVHANSGYNVSLHEHNAHPGLGEAGKYHDPTHESPIAKGTTLRFALVGQQNCGKTTLFNQLTGFNQHVGNFPGVTVDRKDGAMLGYANTVITDLPGVYSLSPYTQEEIVTRRFVIEERPNCIINIVDATNIERNLYLTVQLMELGIPIVLALNMMDELTGNGGSVRVNEMERVLGIPVVPISAAKGEGIRELVEHAMHVAEYREAPARKDFCPKDDNGGAVHRGLHSIMHLIEDHAERAGIPVRFAVSKVVENDSAIIEALQLTQNEIEMLERIMVQMEQERGLDRRAAMADMRFAFIERLALQTVVKPQKSREYIRSKKIDSILTGRWTAIPIFLIVMCLVIWLSIDVLGSPLQAWLNSGIEWLDALCVEQMVRLDVSAVIISLVSDGIFGGVGSVLSFVPVIIILFLFLSVIEDSGYMSRIAFVTDKSLRKLGLSGRSIVPLLIGFGCSVTAVMAARTLPSARDRKLTILLTPFMSCSGKIPIYGFMSAAFFPNHGGLVLVALYLLAIIIGVIVALCTKLFRKNYVAAPFVMELPNYRLPSMGNVWHLLWDKTKDFVQRAITVILIATIVIWFLQTFDFRFNMAAGGEDSMMAWLAGLMEPLFAPIGLGDWRIITSFISGFMAKESVVATMEVLGATGLLTVVTAVPMLLFSLLYTPCVAAIGSIKSELGLKWALYVMLFQCLVAWVVAWFGYLIAQSIVA